MRNPYRKCVAPFCNFQAACSFHAHPYTYHNRTIRRLWREIFRDEGFGDQTGNTARETKDSRQVHSALITSSPHHSSRFLHLRAFPFGPPASLAFLARPIRSSSSCDASELGPWLISRHPASSRVISCIGQKASPPFSTPLSSVSTIRYCCPQQTPLAPHTLWKSSILAPEIRESWPPLDFASCALSPATSAIVPRKAKRVAGKTAFRSLLLFLPMLFLN